MPDIALTQVEPQLKNSQSKILKNSSNNMGMVSVSLEHNNHYVCYTKISCQILPGTKFTGPCWKRGLGSLNGHLYMMATSWAGGWLRVAGWCAAQEERRKACHV
jgi:hypothetical protein